MQFEAVLAPKFRVLAKGGRVCPFQFFKFCSYLITYLTFEVTLDARHLTCAASGFQFCLTSKHPAAREKKKISDTQGWGKIPTCSNRLCQFLNRSLNEPLPITQRYKTACKIIILFSVLA